jgi:hypothetical protein
LNRHLLIVANGFRAVGLLLGIPSLVVCLWLTAFKIDLARSKPDPSAQSGYDINLKRDGIVGVIEVVATVIVTPLELIGKAVDWLAGVFDILAAALTVAAACLFFTGRGLIQHNHVDHMKRKHPRVERNSLGPERLCRSFVRTRRLPSTFRSTP